MGGLGLQSGKREDLLGRPLGADEVRLIINSSKPLERFWRVADPAKQLRTDLTKQGITEEEVALRVDAHIREAIDRLFSMPQSS